MSFSLLSLPIFKSCYLAEKQWENELDSKLKPLTLEAKKCIKTVHKEGQSLLLSQ